jgi:hypothetical protein
MKITLEKEISRCNRNLFILNTVIIIFAGGIVSWFFNSFEIFGKIILFILLFSFPIYNYFKLYKRIENYKNHPIYLHLNRFEDVPKTIERINKDLKSIILRERKFTLTPHWLIIQGLFSLEVIHSSEICWIYLKQTERSVNFIPTGTDYHVMIHTSFLREIEMKCSGKENSEELISLFYSVAPWAFFGFSEEMKGTWGSNTSEIISEVMERMNHIGSLINKQSKKTKKSKKNEKK